MKKILALVLSLMMVFAVACAEEVVEEVSASMNENGNYYTDSDVVVTVEPSENVAALAVALVESENLTDVLPAETVEAVVAMLGSDIVVDDLFTVAIESCDEDVTVKFHMETEFAEGEKVALVFISLDETGAIANVTVVEGVGTADGCVEVALDAATLKTIAENADEIAVLSMTAAK